MKTKKKHTKKKHTKKPQQVSGACPSCNAFPREPCVGILPKFFHADRPQPTTPKARVKSLSEHVAEDIEKLVIGDLQAAS